MPDLVDIRVGAADAASISTRVDGVVIGHAKGLLIRVAAADAAFVRVEHEEVA